MPPRSLTISELPDLVGQPLGSSSWLEISQERVQQFADATNDQQWIHTDPERAAKESPYGAPIAHGYLTLSLIPGFMDEIWGFTDVAMAVNYGLNKVRFPNAVKVGASIRAHAALQELTPIPGGVQCVVLVKIEIDGEEKPACAAESVFRLLALQ